MRRRLRVFHARCVRGMCRVTRKHAWAHHITTEELERRLGVDPIETYLHRRQLRWLGHVRRMDYTQRLPRQMLSSWVAHPRPRGAPPMTYGRSKGGYGDFEKLQPCKSDYTTSQNIYQTCPKRPR